MSDEKTHYRKAFNSPYLSSADIVEETNLTVAFVRLESDRTKKTKDSFNTAHFAEKEIRPGEKLKPMILNATNSRVLKDLSGSPFIEDWENIPVTIYVDHSVRWGSETVDGLRIKARAARLSVTPGTQLWENAKKAYQRDGNLDAVLKRADISDEHQAQLIEECT